MQNFFYFLIRHSTFLFFLLLEGICVALICNYNDYHRASFLSSSNAVMGSVYNATSSVSQYFGLAKANELLLRQNVALMAQADSLRRELAARADSFSVADSLHPVAGVGDRALHFRVGHVINAMTNRSRNMLTLDVGARDGICKDMAVANAAGVVGLVSAVSTHYSLVLPIINTSSRLSVKLAGSNYRGQLIWNGVSASSAAVVDIPEHAHVQVGDTIVTSGASCYFPEGLVVGIVSQVDTDRNGGFYNLDVDLAVDFNSVYAVEIIEDLNALERSELENSALHE